MGKGGFFVFTCFAMATILVVGCGDQKSPPKRAKVGSPDKTRAATAAATAAAKAEAARVAAANATGVLQNGEPIPTHASAVLSIEEIDKKLAQITAGGESVAFENIAAGNYQLEHVVHIARKSKTLLKPLANNQKSAQFTAVAGHSFALTVNAENKLVAEKADVFSNESGAANMPAYNNSIPVSFVIEKGALPKVTRSAVYAEKKEQGKSQMALQENATNSDSLFVELQKIKDAKVERGAYSFKNGNETVYFIFKIRSETLILSKDVETTSADGVKVKSIILLYKKVAAPQPAAANGQAGEGTAGTGTGAAVENGADGGAGARTGTGTSAGTGAEVRAESELGSAPANVTATGSAGAQTNASGDSTISEPRVRQ